MAAVGGERKVAQLAPGQKDVDCIFIVLEKGEIFVQKDEHKVVQCLVADETGSILLSLWDDHVDAFKPGDILRLHKGYASLFRNALVLYVGKIGTLQRIGEFTMRFSETPSMSKVRWTVDLSDPRRRRFIPEPLDSSAAAAAPPQASP